MKRNIASGFASIMGAKVVMLVVGTLTTPILFRLLGPTRFGTYSFVLSIFMLYMIFVSSGVGDGVRKFLAEERPVRDWREHVVGFYFRLAVALALAGAGLLALAAHTGLVAGLFGPEFTEYFYLLTLLVVAAQFREYVRRTLMGFGLERYSEPLHVLNRVALVGVGLALVSLGHGVRGMLVGHVVASLLVVVVGSVPVARHVSLRAVIRRTPRGFPSRELLTFNSLSVLLVFLLMSLYHVDVVMLQPFAGSTQVGHYKAALKLAEFLWFVPMAVQTVFVHSTSELWSKGRHRQISELATRATRYTFLLTAVMAVGLAALADIAVPIYFGPEATPAVTPLLFLLPGALGLAVARPVLAIAQGKGDLRYPIVATGAAALINLALNLLLIPRYGMKGAAIATSVGYGSMLVFHLWSARKVGFDPLQDARLGRIVVTAGISAFPIFALAESLQSDVLALVVVPPAGLIVFLVAAVVTRAVTVAESLDVLARFPAPIGPGARRLRGGLQRMHRGASAERLLQHALVAAGVLLFVSGIGLGVIGPDTEPAGGNADFNVTTDGPRPTPTLTSTTSTPTPAATPASPSVPRPTTTTPPSTDPPSDPTYSTPEPTDRPAPTSTERPTSTTEPTTRTTTTMQPTTTPNGTATTPGTTEPSTTSTTEPTTTEPTETTSTTTTLTTTSTIEPTTTEPTSTETTSTETTPSETTTTETTGTETSTTETTTETVVIGFTDTPTSTDRPGDGDGNRSRAALGPGVALAVVGAVAGLARARR